MNIRRSSILLTALVIDQIIDDPPNHLHPVAWMGNIIAALKRRAPKQGQTAQFGYGALIAGGGIVSMGVVGRLISRSLQHLPAPLAWLGEALLLKMVFTLRGLTDAGEEVKAALTAGDLAEGRRLVAWHLVSRDTSQLTGSQVAAATIESVAENMSDGVIAPLFFYAIGGLPGALAYRYLNTTDSMLGYRYEKHEWLGKTPARLDDLANLLPARLTAGLLMLAAPLTGSDQANARHIWARDRTTTDSPNAGHPMSAMAGALGVELAKDGQYRLGAGERQAEAADIPRAVRLVQWATLIGAVLLALVALLSGRTGQAHE